jgi:hypothetical protein
MVTLPRAIVDEARKIGNVSISTGIREKFKEQLGGVDVPPKKERGNAL